MGTYAIKAEKFVLPGALMGPGYLTVADGVFGAYSDEAPAGAEVLDLFGKWVAPGFVDTHIHGFYNHATTDCDAEGINISSAELARRGTTSWLPTTFTESPEHIRAACAAIAQADEERGPEFAGAHIQGIYLEGPFFTQKHVGAQNPEYLIDPSVELFEDWQEAAGGRIRKSALAPEHDGSVEYVSALAAKGIVTCIGHSDATYDEALAAVNAGATCFVHTYNGMRGLRHDHAGHVRRDHLRRPPRGACRHQRRRARQGLGPRGPHHRRAGLRRHARGRVHERRPARGHARRRLLPA